MPTRLHHAMPTALTASLVATATEAFLAYSDERRTLGPNGEPRIARILHTRDGGATWREVPWVRTLLSRIRHPGFPTWPPETVLRLSVRESCLVISHRDEWVPYEPGGESLWESTFANGEWKTARIRILDYDGHDSPSSIVTQAPIFPTGFMEPPSRA